MRSRDFTSSQELDGGPVLRVEQHSSAQPVRDGLLAEGGPIQESADSHSQNFLRPANLDRSKQGSNVTFLSEVRRVHRPSKYTREFVFVNKPPGMTGDKAPCNLASMAVPKVKPIAKSKAPRTKPESKRGADGRTFGERLHFAMETRGITQKELLDRCGLIAPAPTPDSRPVVYQQLLSNLMRDNQDASRYTVIIAEALGVRGAWLQYGIGAMTFDQVVSESLDFIYALKSLPDVKQLMVREFVASMAREKK